MEKILAVYDQDVLYATRLTEYISKLSWESFEILLFTRLESLLDFLKYNAVEILLYGDDNIPESIEVRNIKYIFCLSKDRKSMEDKYQRIFKYQAAGKITSDILSCYTRLEDSNIKEPFGNVKFISVFSPVAGAEKISFAWLLAKELSKKSKVLLISLDMFSGFLKSEDTESEYAFSEYLYYLKEGSKEHINKLKSCLSYSEKLAYLSGLNHGFDLLSLSKEEALKFIDEMKEHKEYEVIVCFLGIYTEATMEILTNSNQVFLTICDKPYEEMVIKEWERQMELMGIKLTNQKQHIIKLPVLDQAAGISPLPVSLYSTIKPLVEDLTENL